MCICMTGKHSAVCLSRLAGTAIAIDSRALLSLPQAQVPVDWSAGV